MQQLACSFNITMDVTLAVTEERSGSVDALSQRCPSALSSLCHTKLMKSDYIQMESVTLTTAMQLCNLCMPLFARCQGRRTTSSFSPELLPTRFFNEAFQKICIFSLFLSLIAGGWKHNWKGMLFLLDHICWYSLKIYISNHVQNYFKNFHNSSALFFYRKGKLLKRCEKRWVSISKRS